VLFSLKICKNRQKLGALPPDFLSSGGWVLSLQNSHISRLTLRILFSASAHKAQAQTLRNQLNDLLFL